MLNKTLMMNLSSIAYKDLKEIPGLVTKLDPDLSVAWGPAQLCQDGIPYSLCFVAKSASTGAHTVVIRGTELWSWEAWAHEDFAIRETVPFTNFVKGAPAGARLSLGSANGLGDLLRLKSGEQTLIGFLNPAGASSISVTGHSLGGTLTGPLFAALRGQLTSPPPMDLMSFAGLTPGNLSFADYLNGLTPSQGWRVVNPMDIAPLCFTSLSLVEDIYGDQLSPTLPVKAILSKLFGSAGMTYVQPGDQPVVLPKILSINQHMWVTEVLYQHHASTYLSLLAQQD